MTKFTDGLNDRLKDASIAQRGLGLPDDSSQPVEAREEEALRIRSKLKGVAGEERKDAADYLAKQLARASSP
jgi:hypothetical protein